MIYSDGAIENQFIEKIYNDPQHTLIEKIYNDPQHTLFPFRLFIQKR